MELLAGSSTGLSCGNRRSGRVAAGKVWVGIDVGKAAHHACAVDERGEVVFSRKVANGQDAIERLIARTPAKAAPDQVITDLQVLTARREDLMADWVRDINRLRELLASIFPALERAFDYSTRSALILLTGYCTPQGIRDAGAAGLTGYLTEHGARNVPSIVDKSLAAAAEQTVALQGEAVTAPLIARLARQLLDLDREIKELGKHLGDRFAEHPHAEHITSLDGFGVILGAQLLADTGGDLQAAFGNPGRLAAYAGLAPVPRDSGRVRGNLHRPKRYHRGLRLVFYMAAMSAIKRPDDPSRAFYQRKRAEGKLHTQALIALARRLIDVIWALLRDNRSFTTKAPAPVSATA
jgi:transposase